LITNETAEGAKNLSGVLVSPHKTRFLPDESGTFAFFVRFGAKNISDVPEAKLNRNPRLQDFKS